jgi:hypothetical protein
MAGSKVKIDWSKVGKLLQAQCSGASIATMLGIHENTLYERCVTDNGMGFVVFAQLKKSEGKELLRAKQFETAMGGDKTMLIWLGKQYLDQKDKSDVTHKGVLQELISAPMTAEEMKAFYDELGDDIDPKK